MTDRDYCDEPEVDWADERLRLASRRSYERQGRDVVMAGYDPSAWATGPDPTALLDEPAPEDVERIRQQIVDLYEQWWAVRVQAVNDVLDAIADALGPLFAMVDDLTTDADAVIGPK